MCNGEFIIDPILLYVIDRGQDTSIYGLIVNVLGFAGHMISVTTTQLCHYGLKLIIDNI